MIAQLLEDEHHRNIAMAIPNEIQVKQELIKDFDRMKAECRHIGALIKSLLKLLSFSKRLNFSFFREIHFEFEGAFGSFFGFFFNT